MQTKSYFFIDEIHDRSGDVDQIGEIRETHDEIMQDFFEAHERTRFC